MTARALLRVVQKLAIGFLGVDSLNTLERAQVVSQVRGDPPPGVLGSGSGMHGNAIACEKVSGNRGQLTIRSAGRRGGIVSLLVVLSVHPEVSLIHAHIPLNSHLMAGVSERRRVAVDSGHNMVVPASSISAAMMAAASSISAEAGWLHAGGVVSWVSAAWGGAGGDAGAAQRDASAAVDRAIAAVADEAMATAAVTVVVGVGLTKHISIRVLACCSRREGAGRALGLLGSCKSG